MIFGIAFAAALSSTALAQDHAPLECDNLWKRTSDFSNREAVPICRELLRVLDQPTLDDLKHFEQAAFLLRHEGYQKDSVTITRELVEIIRLRGLYNQQPRWDPTLDAVWKGFNFYHGAITPLDIVDFLKSAGPKAAKALSDEGLLSVIVLLKHQRQEGN
jgi:hypothetical protein